QAQIVGLMFDGLQSNFIPELCKLADSLRGDALAMRIARRRVAFNPRHHGRTGGYRFPTAVEAARAGRTCGIDYVMANLRMSAVDTTVELPIENDSTANPGADGHIDQACPIPASAPTGFRERGGVAVVLQGHTQVEYLRQILDGTLPAPTGKKINVSKFAAHRIDRPRRSDADAGEFHICLACGFTQHAGNE